MHDIVIGRSMSDVEQLGTKGTVLLGKHYIKMGQTTSLSNNIYLDVIRSHVVFICGKRGGGKSYTMGVIAEGLSDLEPAIAQNLSIILLDTMGIYWTMKYPNKKEELLLEEWKFRPHGLDIDIYTPFGFYNEYKKQGIPTDYPFSVPTNQMSSDDWCKGFDVPLTSPLGVFIQKSINHFKDDLYDIDDIIAYMQQADRVEEHVRDAAMNYFQNAKAWGVFDKEGTPIETLAKGGRVTVLDVSCYATIPNGWTIKSMVVGLVSQKLFNERMRQRKDEEFAQIHSSMHYFSESQQKEKQEYPLVWLVIDEAHEFLPNQGSTLASDPLITILREGRQPGISLILATQQPGKIHTDVMTQSDTVIAHRITAKLDTEALGTLMQSYMRTGLTEALDNLPRTKGSAIIFDDNNEKMYPMRVRPRFTWHGGESPTAMPKKKDYKL
ncbi:MAG: ATP-binding protein [Candidatus Woesearchaeota archaeon]